MSRIVALFLVLALVAPTPLLAQPLPNFAQIRGVLLDAEGLPAEGYQIGLKNEAGDLFLSAPAGPDGSFAVANLPPAEYRLVAFAPDGTEFPVLGRSVPLRAGQVERVELRLASPEGQAPGRDPEQLARTREATASSRFSGGFFGSTLGKVVLVSGGIFAAVLVADAIDDDAGDPPDVSPSEPE